MTKSNKTELRELLRLYKRHPGSMSLIARKLGITHVSVRQCLHGLMNSDRIRSALIEHAVTLRQKELDKQTHMTQEVSNDTVTEQQHS